MNLKKTTKQKGYKLLKCQLVFVLSLIIITSSLMACTQDNYENDDNNGHPINGSGNEQVEGGEEGEVSMVIGSGRFVETERSLPGSIDGILDMVVLEDDTIRMIDRFANLYDSTDGGITWICARAQLDLPEVGDERLDSLLAASLHPQGGAFLSFVRGHLYIDATGEKHWLELDLPLPDFATVEEDEDPIDEMLRRRVWQTSFTCQGYVLGTGMSMEAIHLINPRTGELIRTFGGEGDWIIHYDFIGINHQVFAFTARGLHVYDMETGRIIVEDSAIQEYFGNQRIGDPNVGHGRCPIRVFPARDRGAMYVANSDGLYRYVFGASQVEQLIDGSLTMMSHREYTFRPAVEKDHHNFLISYLSDSSVERLMDYTFHLDADLLARKEITVFSLFDNHAIRQAGAIFQSQNPHIAIHFEVGIPMDDQTTTISDAVSTLNTQIMAGSGPDILLLGGLPYEAYIENDVLLDLSAMVASLQEGQRFFDNILESYGMDEALYMVPLAFFPILSAGPEGLLENTMNLPELANTVEALRRDNYEIRSIMGYDNQETLLRKLLHYVYAELITEDGIVNREMLAGFLADARRIYQANWFEETPPVEMSNHWGHSGIFGVERDITAGMGFSVDQQELAVGVISTFFSLDTLTSIIGDTDWDYAVHSAFVPVNTLGINARSDRLEESISFVRFLLSADMQSSAEFVGMPVNQAGFLRRHEEAGVGQTDITGLGEDGEFMYLTVYGASVEQLDRLMEALEGVDRISSPNRFVLEAVLGEGIPFLSGLQSLEETVEQILARVNLVLAE